MQPTSSSTLAMKNSHNPLTSSLFQLGLMEIELPQDDPLVRLEKEIPWEAMIAVVEQLYSNTTGRNAIPHRVMLGLEIAKHRLGLSDEDIVAELRVNIALQHFCGWNTWTTNVPDSSSLTKFRGRLTEEVLEQLERAAIRTYVRKTPERRRHQVITDSTCVPGTIAYPTDSRLLTKVVNKLVSALRKLRSMGGKMLIRGKQKVKSAVRGFNLKRKKTSADIRAFNQYLVEMAKRLLAQTQQTMTSMDNRVSQQASIMRTRLMRTLDTIADIIAQQEQMLITQTRRVKNRIVSLHAPLIRPILRFKDQARVEFGQKLGLNLIAGGLLQINHLSHDSTSDTELVGNSIAAHEATFGRKPRELIVDRGGHSPNNHALLQRLKITDGIQYRGTVPAAASPPKQSIRKRLYRQRVVIEGKIGTFKRRYGGDRNRLSDNNTRAWITFGLLTMNGVWATKQGG
jgi:hypothetical protein